MSKTMTVEEVEQLRDAVRNAICGELRTDDTVTVLTSCARLAAQAARVPGLEEELHGDRYAIFGALMWSGMWPMGVEKLKPSCHVSALLKRLQQAESERDAARKGLEGAEISLKNFRTLKGMDEETIQALRERVATLEREVRAQDDARLATECDLTTAGISVDDGLHDAVHVLIQARDTAEARVRELEEDRAVALAVLADLGAPEHSADDEVPPGAPLGLAERIRRMALASQPPSGPGGGEKCSGCDGKGYDEDVDDDCKGHRFACTSCKGTGKAQSTRARIAPAPTPSSRDVAMRRLLGAVGNLVSVYSDITGETPAEVAASFQPMPETPHNPDVVWEGNGVRVRDMDPIGIVVDNPGTHPLNEVSLILARALAETKREVGEMRKAHEAVQYAARNCSWATAGGEVVAIHCERLRDGAEKAAREAAESMRERAKQAILKQQATEEDGPTSDDNGYAFNMLIRLANEVGKLPLK